FADCTLNPSSEGLFLMMSGIPFGILFLKYLCTVVQKYAVLCDKIQRNATLFNNICPPVIRTYLQKTA
ncbi:MAG: hypothetical protein IJJ24_02430, partial [Solobacterium sp.]|nr:hypothetical protein [Solobacterium sp.]